LIDSQRQVAANAATTVEKCEQFAMQSSLYNYAITLSADQQAALWCLPLFTVSLSEGGFEKVQQGCLLLPQWQVKIASGESWNLHLQVKLGSIETATAPQAAASGQARS